MRVLVVVAAALVVAVAFAVPVSQTNPEYKPSLPKPAAPAGDEYEELASPVREPVDPHPSGTHIVIPQTGSLLQINAGQSGETSAVPDASGLSDQVESKPYDSAAAAAASSNPNKMKLAEAHELQDQTPAVNMPNQHYPVENEATIAHGSSAEQVALPPVLDPQNKSANGISPGVVTFDRPDNPHPMEKATPLVDNFPCDPDRRLEVTVPSASASSVLPSLPLRFGCSSGDDISREKLSPSVSWTNVYEDVFEFSLQLVEMGDNCETAGSGRILWHVTGIKPSATVTLQEGASHDSRMLFGGVEQPNQWLEEYYSGPCPLDGTTGCYRFKVLGHRQKGNCQCGHADFTFARPEKREEWQYKKRAVAYDFTTPDMANVTATSNNAPELQNSNETVPDPNYGLVSSKKVD